MTRRSVALVMGIGLLVAAGGVAPAEAAGRTYVVRRGDTLRDIAARELGDPMKWRRIAEANRIADPERLGVGTVLTIPGARPAGASSPAPERPAAAPTASRAPEPAPEMEAPPTDYDRSAQAPIATDRSLRRRPARGAELIRPGRAERTRNSPTAYPGFREREEREADRPYGEGAVRGRMRGERRGTKL